MCGLFVAREFPERAGAGVEQLVGEIRAAYLELPGVEVRLSLVPGPADRNIKEGDSPSPLQLDRTGADTESPRMAIFRVPSQDVRTSGSESMADGLVDELLSYYIDWRRDARAVEDAYRLWSIAPAGEDALGFFAYMTAVDQEESSAARYAVVLREVERALQPDASVSDPP